MIFVKEYKIDSIDTCEVLRYMRAGTSFDGEIVSVAASACDSVLAAARCAVCYTRLPVSVGIGNVMLGELRLESAGTVKRLADCSEAYIFCATAGVGVDREIQRAGVKSALAALACDCAGSALVEQVCDELQKELSGMSETTDRFSAGYGDLSIEYQCDLAELLQTKKHIGVSLTDGLMMTPTKSVIALVGIKKRD